MKKLSDVYKDMLGDGRDHSPYAERMKAAETYFDKLRVVSEYYKEVEPKLLATHEESKDRFYNPYPFDWGVLFSPIESLAWSCIRTKGRMVLYPQYPVLNYHLDFGNPGFKIGLELDGKEFHDSDKDIERDEILKKEGWIIFRITGREMNNLDFIDPTEIYEEHRDEYKIVKDNQDWLVNTGDGVIEAIKQVFFNADIDKHYETYIGERFISDCYRTLDYHNLMGYTIEDFKERSGNG